MSTNQNKVDVLRRKQKIRFSSETIPTHKPVTLPAVEAPPFKVKKPFPVPVKSVPIM